MHQLLIKTFLSPQHSFSPQSPMKILPLPQFEKGAQRASKPPGHIAHDLDSYMFHQFLGSGQEWGKAEKPNRSLWLRSVKEKKGEDLGLGEIEELWRSWCFGENSKRETYHFPLCSQNPVLISLKDSRFWVKANYSQCDWIFQISLNKLNCAKGCFSNFYLKYPSCQWKQKFNFCVWGSSPHKTTSVI